MRTDQLTRMIDDATAAWNVAGLRVYFVGIGGCGMSGLVRMLQARGAGCTGSDRIATPATEALLTDGIGVGFDQRAEALPSQCDLLVISAAVSWDHPQVLAAHERGIEVIRYAQALGRCMLGRMGIAVAGTHGKSTTSAMLAYVLTQCGLDPSFIIGATCRQLGGGSHVGTPTDTTGQLADHPKLLIAEACEYDRSFHSLHPTRAIITSVESDHLDVYGTLDAVVESFTHFAQLLPDASQDGHLLIAHDNAHRREVTAGLQCEVETIGFSPAADWTVTYRAPTVELAHHGEQICTWSMQMPGEHNAMNAACAAAAALALPGELASGDRVGEALSGFRGLDRRLQFLGEREVDGLHGDVGTVRVYDDYGHHPSEIDATLRAVRQHEQLSVFGGRLVCVFQPHQHSRTRFLLEEFAQSFSSADVVIVPHIYFVRDSEAEKHKVSARDLVDRLRSRGVTAMHLYPFDAIVETLQSVCRPGDVLVVMGAGPVWQVAHDYLASGQTIEDVS
ncbi:MAG: UDP-N-acetylmuramate--L-alanine ligase [Phycisphaerales bacterium]|nr:UDP-N-acetylmuramate--L-alanine ligase [Phycisphaerales bacterium]